MKNYAVIVAGGSGSRMQANQPKQFMELAGLPILMHTIDAFFKSGLDMNIILVLPDEHLITWQDLISAHRYTTPHQLTTGGLTRFNSVKNGLDLISDEGIVAIHDGARPLVTTDIIQRTVTQAKSTGSGIAAVQVKDSIRQISNDGSSVGVDRNEFYTVQTPQTFDVALIKKAFNNTTLNNFTDDASVAEAFGEKIVMVEGSYDNLKITTPEDLKIAAAILAGTK